ncbi:MAG TPA: TRAP transporter TatT component family protein [Kofleriaceae bacterium]|nr:TRAP transporter TatT component family protein [Kofleriaceae bacterium]
MAALLAGLTTFALGACDLGQVTVNTTAKVLARAQPSLKMESDYELAARAIPGTLKTVEGFWVVSPNNPQLLGILAEGYCQYGVGFVEDEWEQATIKKDFDAAQYHSTRATKMFIRCMNYALKQLGSRWQKQIFSDTDTVTKLIHDTGSGKRTPMMWAAIGLASAINQNKDNIDMVAQLATAKAMLERVVELDAKHPPADKALAALPHVALGMVYTAAGAQLGGDAAKATEHFKKALELTGDKFLLARVQYARRVGVMTQDRKLFHDELLKVLQTDPAIWPEQRLANEIAQRRARRYLSIEKELF